MKKITATALNFETQVTKHLQNKSGNRISTMTQSKGKKGKVNKQKRSELKRGSNRHPSNQRKRECQREARRSKSKVSSLSTR